MDTIPTIKELTILINQRDRQPQRRYWPPPRFDHDHELQLRFPFWSWLLIVGVSIGLWVLIALAVGSIGSLARLVMQ